MLKRSELPYHNGWFSRTKRGSFLIQAASIDDLHQDEAQKSRPEGESGPQNLLLQHTIRCVRFPFLMLFPAFFLYRFQW
jgi:hypothetical protein